MRRFFAILILSLVFFLFATHSAMAIYPYPEFSEWHFAVSTGSSFTPMPTWDLIWGGPKYNIPLTGDFNNDNMADIALYLPYGYPNWYVKLSTGSGFSGGWSTSWGNNWDVSIDFPLVGDFNNDGRDDIAIFRADSYPNWFVNLSTGSGFSGGWSTSWGNLWFEDLPLVGNFDLGADDIMIYRWTGYPNWFANLSSGSSFPGTARSASWGNPQEDIPLVGNFFNDPMSADDLLIYRTNSDPNWFVRLTSTTGFGTETSWSTFWGNRSGDVPLVGNFDGGLHDDILIYRTTSYPNWFVNLSSGSGFSGTAWSLSWGNLDEDYVLVGDFNGDGRDDICIYRLVLPDFWIQGSRSDRYR